MKRQLLLLLLVGGVLLPMIVQAQDEAKWTIIYYSAADNDLEPFMIGDIMELQEVGSSDEVNIVLQIDRAEGYDAVNGDWTDTRRFYVTQAGDNVSSGDFQISKDGYIDNLRSIDLAELGLTEDDLNAEIELIEGLAPAEFEQFVLGTFNAPLTTGEAPLGLQIESMADVGEINTGDPQALVDFAVWAIQEFPAEHYMLIISNHGGAWTSVAIDETSSSDGLIMPELDSALAQIIDQTGIGFFDLVAFDACLMGQLEVFQTLAPYAEYAVTAEEVIPGAGWEYTVPLQALIENPDMTVPEFGQSVVDSYMDYYSNVLTGYEAFDLHVIDLTQVDNVTAALDNFASAVQANPLDNLKPIGNARNNAQIFSADDPDGADYYSSVDLADFMQLLIQLTPDPDVSEAAQVVIDAAAQMVVYGNASPGLPGSNGTAIYFPANTLTYALGENNINYSQQVPAAMQSWIAFLDTFHGAAVETFLPGELSIAITDVLPADSVASIWDPPVVLFETNGEGIVDIEFYVSLNLDDGTQIILDQSPLVFTVFTPDGDEITEFPEGLSQNEFTWNVEMPVVTDGENSVETLLTQEPSALDEALIEGVYHWSSGETADAYAVFAVETQTLTSVWGIQEAQSGQAISEISPARGDTFEPYLQFFDENGEVVYVPSGVELKFGDEPFTYEFVPAVSGDYEFVLWMEDMAGNVAADVTNFSVDNEGLDTSYRGFKDVSIGINFLFPWGWTDPSVTENEDGSYTLSVSDPVGDISIFVNTYEAASLDEILETALIVLDDFGAAYNEPQFAELGDYESYIVEYSYEGDTETRVGVQLVVYEPENGLGYIVDVDTIGEQQDMAWQIFADIVQTILFFTPLE